MVEDLEVDLRIVAPTEVIEALEQAMEAAGQPVTVSPVLDASYLGLDFSTAADLAAIASVTLISDPLIPSIAKWFSPKAKARRIRVETPLGRVTFDTTEALSEDQIRERLGEIVKLF